MEQGGTENVLDLRVARWGKNPVMREILEAIETMTDHEKLHLLEHDVGFILWERTDEASEMHEENKLLFKKSYVRCDHCDVLSMWSGPLSEQRCRKCGSGNIHPVQEVDWEGIDWDYNPYQKCYVRKPGKHLKWRRD
jgi:hypothetical protein